MTEIVKSEYSLDKSYFSFWQVITFVLVFAFVGSWVLRTFAGGSEVKSLTIVGQPKGTVQFKVITPKKPADDLVITNSCLFANLSNSQTAAFSDWTYDSSAGYIGQVSFNLPPKQKCSATVHISGEPKSLATYSYFSL